MLAGCGVHGELRGTADKASFEHECQCALELYRFQIGCAGTGEGFGVRAVAAHAVVQAGSAWDESFGFGIVLALDEAHKLIHEVAMEPRRAERVLGDNPAWGKDGEVHVSSAVNLAGRREDGVDGGVRVVEADGVDAVEASQVILAGGIVAVPGDDIEWGMIEV